MKKTTLMLVGVAVLALKLGVNASAAVTKPESGPAISSTDALAVLQAIVQKAIGNGKVFQVQAVVKGGQTYYVVQVEDPAGKTYEIVLDANGNLVGNSQSDPGANGPTPVKPADLPAWIQAAIEKAAGNGKVLQAEEVTKDGQTYYAVEIEDANGKTHEIVLDAKGNPVTSSTSGDGNNVANGPTPVKLADLPAWIQAAIEKAAGNGKVLQAEEVTKNGQTYYAAEIEDAKGKTYEIVLDAKGNLVTSSTSGDGNNGANGPTPVKLADLPAWIQAAIEKAAGNGKVLRAEEVTKNGQTYYLVQIRNAKGKTHTVVLDAKGNPVGKN
jgi:uncharacterized membrane protein YkoI